MHQLRQREATANIHRIDPLRRTGKGYTSPYLSYAVLSLYGALTVCTIRYQYTLSYIS